MADLTVSIIIITYNRPFLLKHCLERVLAQSYTHKEIIVVDSSTNDESERVVAQYPEVIHVRLHGQRNNMPQARNEGMAISSGDIIACIDDDSMIQLGWLEAVVNAYSDKTVGAVGGRIIDMPEPFCDQLSGSPCLIIKPSGRVFRQGVGLLSTESREVDHLPGANMSFRREALEQVGGFDPHYILVNLREETDLCIRVKKAGWRIMFVPAMAQVHFSPRVVQNPYLLERPRYQFSAGYSTMYFAIKHFGFHPRALTEALLLTGRRFARAAYYTLHFVSGSAAYGVGHIAGLVMGIAWHMNSQLRATSAPRIWRGEQVGTEQVPLPVASQSESLT